MKLTCRVISKDPWCFWFVAGVAADFGLAVLQRHVRISRQQAQLKFRGAYLAAT